MAQPLAAPPRHPPPPAHHLTPARDTRWDLLLLCVALYIVTAVGRFHQLFPALAPLKPVLVTGGLSIALYLAAAKGIRGVGKLWLPTTKFILLLLVWVALSVPGALWPGGSFLLLTDDFIKTIVMYLIILGAVRGGRDVERLTFVYFLSAAMYAAVVLSRFDVSDSERLGALYYYDANDFATFIVTALPLGFYFLLGQRRLAVRILAGAGLVALTIAFIKTGSRGGFLALLGAAVFFLVGFSSVRLSGRVLATVAIGVIFTLSTSDSYWERMRTILNPKEDYNYASSGGRWQLWRRGIGYMLQHPVLGVGAANFPTAEGRISPLAKQQERGHGLKWSAAHNSYVQIGAELGIPGLVFFLAVILTSFRALRAARRSEQGPAPPGRGPPRLAHPLMTSLVGFVVGAFFLSLGYQGMLYTLAALAVALYKVRPATLAAARPAPVLWRADR